MKTKVFFYSLMMGLVMVSSTLNVFAEEEKKKPVKIEIPMIEDQESAYDDRGLVVIPLKAYYQGETIYLDFTHNVCGECTSCIIHHIFNSIINTNKNCL